MGDLSKFQKTLLKHVKIRFVTILRNVNIPKIFSHIGSNIDAYSFKVVILILTLKLVKQHAKSQAEITQEKF